MELSAAAIARDARPAVPTGAAAVDAPPEIPLAPIKRVQARFNLLADGMLYLVVFLGGFLGTVMRYGLSLALPAPLASDGFFSAFHTATFLANMLACFIFAGLTMYVSQASWMPKRVRQLTSRGVGMGVCGGFSTLSAMVIEELASIREGQIAGFLCYMLLSFAGGLAVAWFGARLALVTTAKREARVVADAASSMRGASGAAHALASGMPVAGVDMVTGLPKSGMVTVGAATPPEGDYGQPLPSFEPAPTTDEIPLVGDPMTGEVRG